MIYSAPGRNKQAKDQGSNNSKSKLYEFQWHVNIGIFYYNSNSTLLKSVVGDTIKLSLATCFVSGTATTT